MINVIGTSYRFHNTLDREKIGEKLELISQSLQYQVFLKTCNRSELYYYQEKREEPFIHDCGYRFQGKDVMEHLLKVISGIDSAIIGEPEITGQVRKAYLNACNEKKCNTLLHQLFQKSLFYSKKIRKETDLPYTGTSYFEEAVKWTLNSLEINEPKILILGAGRTGQMLLKNFQKLKVLDSVTIASRKDQLLDELKQEFLVNTISTKEALPNLSFFDAVIVATVSPHPIVTLERIENPALLKKLIICDISATSNVAPEVFPLVKSSKTLDDFIKEFSEKCPATGIGKAMQMIQKILDSARI